jgi:hypothetical protein
MASGTGGYNPVANWMKGVKYTSADNPEWGNALAGGAGFHMGVDLEGDRAAYTKRLIQKAIDPNSLVDTPNKFKALLHGGFDWWKEVGERSDWITRGNRYDQVYQKLVSEGVNHANAHLEASYQARDVCDYSLHGTYPALRMISQTVPFMNARMQGLYKLGRAAGDNPARFSAVVGGITLATMALSASQWGDKDIEAASDWDKNNNWLVKIGKTMYRIPKPFEVGAMATVVDRAFNVAMHGFSATDREKFRWQVAKIVGSQLNMNPIPQALFPALELWANKNAFTGEPIEPGRDEKLSPTQHIGPSSSVTGQLVSKGLNTVLPDAVTLSPQQFDFAVSAWFGWVGSHAVATADLALRPAGLAPTSPTRRVDDYFLLGDFVKQLPQDTSQYLGDFYDHAAKIQQAFGDMRAFQATGQIAKAVEQMKAKGDLIGLNAQYTRTMAEIGKINSRLRYVQMSGADPDVKRAQVDALSQVKNMLAKQAEMARDARLNR